MLVPGSSTPLLAHSAAAAATGISRSLRFNSSDSAYCSRVPASAGNRKTWTWAGWVKRSALGSRQNFFGTGDASFNYSFWVEFFNDDTLRFGDYTTTHTCLFQTSQVFRDTASWGHIVLAVDTTQSTSANRVKAYWNGVQITAFGTATYPSQNLDTQLNTTTAHGIGRAGSYAAQYFSGCLADVFFIDGSALTPSSFTETDATTGQLIPKAYTGSYGTNGFHLEFADNSSNTATTLGKDTSGNSNNWTPNNLSVTAGAGNDSLVDVPTSSGTDSGLGGEVRGNYATFNPLITSAATLTNGNLDASISNTTRAWSTIALPSGKWYAEITLTAVPELVHCGVIDGSAGTYVATYISNGQKTIENSSSAYGASYAANDVIGIAIDVDSKSAQFFKNGSSQGTFNWTNTYSPYYLAFESRGGVAGTRTATANFGQRAFAYTAPSGFKALCTANLPAPLVTKPSTVMDVKLYTGNGSTQTISGLGFSPDLVWIKARNTTWWNALYDVLRGTNQRLVTNVTDAEGTTANSVTSFNSDGFTTGSYIGTNNLNDTFVAWTWDAGTTTVTNNTAGTITPTGVRANATAGFSVVGWNYPSGTGASTIGHGLGVKPGMIILKNRDSTGNWIIYHSAIGATKCFRFTTAAASTESDPWNNTEPTSTVFSIGAASWHGSGNIIAYCFAPVVGYSAMGSWIGNGSSTAGPFVYTGFRVRWLMFKRSDAVNDWFIFDTARLSYNANGLRLCPNLSNAEADLTAAYGIDFLSNGFRVNGNDPFSNASGGTYIYYAVAESPFNYARAR